VGETIGFLGTGRIASAVVEGLMRAAGPAAVPVVVSPRNAERAAALADRFPGELWPPLLFDGSEEGVHIDMEDPPHRGTFFFHGVCL